MASSSIVAELQYAVGKEILTALRELSYTPWAALPLGTWESHFSGVYLVLPRSQIPVASKTEVFAPAWGLLS